MSRLIATLGLLLMPALHAWAQNAPEGPPTTFTEPAGMLGVIVFFVLFVGSIALFGVWIWRRDRKHDKHD